MKTQTKMGRWHVIQGALLYGDQCEYWGHLRLALENQLHPSLCNSSDATNQALTQAPALRLPDPEKAFQLYVHKKEGIALGVLSQRHSQ